MGVSFLFSVAEPPSETVQNAQVVHVLRAQFRLEPGPAFSPSELVVQLLFEVSFLEFDFIVEGFSKLFFPFQCQLSMLFLLFLSESHFVSGQTSSTLRLALRRLRVSFEGRSFGAFDDVLQVFLGRVVPVPGPVLGCSLASCVRSHSFTFVPLEIEHVWSIVVWPGCLGSLGRQIHFNGAHSSGEVRASSAGGHVTVDHELERVFDQHFLPFFLALLARPSGTPSGLHLSVAPEPGLFFEEALVSFSWTLIGGPSPKSAFLRRSRSPFLLGPLARVLLKKRKSFFVFSQIVEKGLQRIVENVFVATCFDFEGLQHFLFYWDRPGSLGLPFWSPNSFSRVCGLSLRWLVPRKLFLVSLRWSCKL